MLYCGAAYFEDKNFKDIVGVYKILQIFILRLTSLGCFATYHLSLLENTHIHVKNPLNFVSLKISHPMVLTICYTPCAIFSVHTYSSGLSIIRPTVSTKGLKQDSLCFSMLAGLFCTMSSAEHFCNRNIIGSYRYMLISATSQTHAYKIHYNTFLIVNTTSQQYMFV